MALTCLEGSTKFLHSIIKEFSILFTTFVALGCLCRAEIIPVEPAQVMLRRECFPRMFLCIEADARFVVSVR